MTTEVSSPETAVHNCRESTCIPYVTAVGMENSTRCASRGWDGCSLHLVITALNSLFVELWFPSQMSPPLRAEISAFHRGTDSAIALSQGRGARHHRLAHLPQSTPLSAGCPHVRQTRV